MPRKPRDLTGMRFGRLTVLHLDSEEVRGTRLWICLCDCGNRTRVTGGGLTSKNSTKSCGCLKRDVSIATGRKNRRHGYSHKTPEYRSWQSMKSRCNLPSNPSYAWYGGRGIKVCARWERFENFIEDVGPRPGPTYSLERIDVNQGYEPENVRWGTPIEQGRNRTDNRRIEYNGEVLTLSEWAERTGLSRAAIAYRIDSGWTLKDALSRELHSGLSPLQKMPNGKP